MQRMNQENPFPTGATGSQVHRTASRETVPVWERITDGAPSVAADGLKDKQHDQKGTNKMKNMNIASELNELKEEHNANCDQLHAVIMDIWNISADIVAECERYAKEHTETEYKRFLKAVGLSNTQLKKMKSATYMLKSPIYPYLERNKGDVSTPDFRKVQLFRRYFEKWYWDNEKEEQLADYERFKQKNNIIEIWRSDLNGGKQGGTV